MEMNFFSLSETSASVCFTRWWGEKLAPAPPADSVFLLLIIYSASLPCCALLCLVAPGSCVLFQENRAQSLFWLLTVIRLSISLGLLWKHYLTNSVLSDKHEKGWMWFIALWHCDQYCLWKELQYSRDNVHEPHLNPSPQSAVWPAETPWHFEHALKLAPSVVLYQAPISLEGIWFDVNVFQRGVKLLQLPLCGWCSVLAVGSHTMPDMEWESVCSSGYVGMNERQREKKLSLFSVCV